VDRRQRVYRKRVFVRDREVDKAKELRSRRNVDQGFAEGLREAIVNALESINSSDIGRDVVPDRQKRGVD
jgi:hypothetical protein